MFVKTLGDGANRKMSLAHQFIKPFLIIVVMTLACLTITVRVLTGEAPTFNVNFVILAPNHRIHDLLSDAHFEQSINRLNASFRDSKGQQIVRFQKSSIQRKVAIQNSSCHLLNLGSQIKKPRRADVYQAYDDCHDPAIKNPNAINVYIFESSWEADTPWKTSYAFFNWFRQPFIMLNWETYHSGYKVPDVHEMGHILGGLLHLDVCGSTDATPTNVMAGQSDHCEGTGGNRSLGFTDWQLGFVRLFAPFVAMGLR
jgi:hypothetical protein